MREEFKPQLQEFSKGMIEDIFGLCEISDWVRKTFNETDEKEVIKLTLEFVQEALDAGFKVGQYVPSKDFAFLLWNDQSAAYVCSRIKKEWHELGRKPNIGDIAWFGLPGYDYPTA